MIVNSKDTTNHLDKRYSYEEENQGVYGRLDGADSESIHLSMLLCNCGCCQGVDAGSEGNKVTLSTRHPILDLCQKDTIHLHCGHVHTGLCIQG